MHLAIFNLLTHVPTLSPVRETLADLDRWRTHRHVILPCQYMNRRNLKRIYSRIAG